MEVETISGLSAVISAVISALVSGWITIMLSKKQLFINTITIARKEYLFALREAVVEFCIIASIENENNRRLIELSYKLKAFMNPAGDEEWDSKAVNMINKIVKEKNKKDIDDFMTLMQSWFAVEWRGMKEESKKGVLKDKQVKKNKEEEYQKYQEYKNELLKTTIK